MKTAGANSFRRLVARTPLGALHRWLVKPPAKLDRQFADFFALSNYTHALGLLSHLFFLVLFTVLKLPALALFNVLSVAVFLFTLGCSKRGLVNIALLVGGIEVAMHQGLAMVALGLEPAFQNYIFILVMGTLFYGHIPLPVRIGMAILPMLWFVPVYLYVLHHQPWYTVSPLVMDGLATMNLVFFIVIIMGICIYFQHSVQAARVQAEKMAESKTFFLANMSHELRTPLNAILGFAQILRRSENLTPQDQRNLTTINRSGEHLLELINGILDMSKLEEGKLALSPATGDLPALLQGVHNMFSLAARERQLDLRLTLAPDLPSHVRMDELRLRQVLINLLGNALKFTNHGEVLLSAGVASRPAPNRAMLIFRVQDTGAGIAREEMGDLFQLFTQTDAGRRSRKGTGLGLALSKRFVELMGGRIGVESELGKGSTFWFEVPVEIAAAPVPSLAVGADQPVRVQADRPFRMLVVDDNAENRDVLRQLLEAVGFETASAADGAAGVAEWERFSPDLIWMDLRMPVMDGSTACRTILERARTSQRPAPKIIAITASSLEESHARIEPAGFIALVGKPFRESELYRLMAQHLPVTFVPVATTTAPATPVSGTGDFAVRLAKLSPALRAALKEAAMLADYDRLQNVCTQVAAADAVLAPQLTALLENYRFDLIQAALEKNA